MEAGKLPVLVVSAIESACASGRKLSWKIQEGDRGMLVQLVWKSANGSRVGTEKVVSNWNNQKRKSPSRLRRDAQRFHRFQMSQLSTKLPTQSEIPARQCADVKSVTELTDNLDRAKGQDSAIVDSNASVVPTDTGQLKETGASKPEASPIVKLSSYLQCLSDSTDVVCPAYHSPVAMHTRSHAQVRMPSDKQHGSLVQDCAVSTVDPVHGGYIHATESSSTDTKVSRLVLRLPNDLPAVTQHYIDFVRCDQYETAMKVKECMQQQWSHIIIPGLRVKGEAQGSSN